MGFTFGIGSVVKMESVNQSINTAPLPCENSCKKLLSETLRKTHKAISMQDNIIRSIIKLFMRRQGNK